jgi:DNA polymerase III subunit delta'
MMNLLDIVGQDRAIAQLQRGLHGQRSPHALMFAGPEGVGRETTATAFAALLLCPQPVKIPRRTLQGRFADLPEDFALVQACGQCHDCRMMDSRSHPDFHPVYKELARYHENSQVRDRVMQELGIDVIDSFLITPAGRSPSRGRGKVFVIRQAELMSDAAQNALLKTLEEPPPGVTIILLCNQPQQMLPTTISRCRVVPFHLLPRDFVAGRLAEQGLAPLEAQFWARYTDGSIGRAMELSQAQMYEVKQHILDRLAAMPPTGDAELGEHLHKITEKLADETIQAVKKSQGAEMSKSLATRQAAGAMLELIASAYADAMHLRAGMDADAPVPPIVHQDQEPKIAALAGRFSASQLAEIIEQLSEYEQLLWRNVSGKLVWENVVITCASAAPLKL